MSIKFVINEEFKALKGAWGSKLYRTYLKVEWEEFMYFPKSDFKHYGDAGAFLARLFPPPWKLDAKHVKVSPA